MLRIKRDNENNKNNRTVRKKMGIISELQNLIKNSGILMFFVALFFYFAFFTINGERGLRRYLHLRQEIEYAEQVAAKYSQEKAQLEEKIKLMSSSSLDLDMLDERARKVLNLVKKDEFVILDEE